MLAEEWSALLHHARPGARAIFRSAGRDAAFIWPTRVRFQGSEEKLGDLLRSQPDLAGRLHERDRVHTYGSFHIVDFPS